MDPSPESLEREFPGWTVWRGVSELWYARRLNTSPPVILRDENLTGLRAQMVIKRDELASPYH
jgi:hypothetical protein